MRLEHSGSAPTFAIGFPLFLCGVRYDMWLFGCCHKFYIGGPRLEIPHSRRDRYRIRYSHRNL